MLGQLAAFIGDPPVPAMTATITVGLSVGEGRHQRQLDPTVYGNLAREIALKFWNTTGSTHVDARGVYRAQSGVVVRERSIVITVVDPYFGDARDEAAMLHASDHFERDALCFARALAQRFEQETVAVVVRRLVGPDRSALVSQKENVRGGCARIRRPRRIVRAA